MLLHLFEVGVTTLVEMGDKNLVEVEAFLMKSGKEFQYLIQEYAILFLSTFICLGKLKRRGL